MNWQYHADSRCCVKSILATVALTLCLSTFGVSTQAASGPVRLNVDVPSGKWKGVRLRNLPKDAVVAVEVQSSGEILVVLVDSGDYLRYPHSARSLPPCSPISRRGSSSTPTRAVEPREPARRRPRQISSCPRRRRPSTSGRTPTAAETPSAIASVHGSHRRRATGSRRARALRTLGAPSSRVTAPT